MWQEAANESDLQEGSARSVEVAGKKIALFKTGGKVYALADSCIHRGGPLGQGHLDGSTVTCPWHAWDFDVKNGECKTMEGAKQPRYAVKIENGRVLVDL